MITIPNEVNITITAQDLTGPAFASALAKMDALRAAARNIGKEFDGMSGVKLDPGQMTASLNTLKSKIQSLGIADMADINVQPGRISVQLNLLKRLIQQAKISDVLDINANTSDLEAQLSKLSNITETIPVNFKVNEPNIPPRFFVAPSAGLPTLVPGATGHNIQDRVSVVGLADATAQTNLLTGAFSRLINTKDNLSNDIDHKLVPSVKAAGNAVSSTGRITFGWRGILFGSIGVIGIWHVILDGAIEALISIGAAAAAAAVGIAAMAPAAENIGIHLEAIQVVSSSLGVNIPPLTGKFSDLAQALAPQVIEAYGGALNLVNGQAGTLTSVAHQVVDMFDNWIARLDIWIKSQSTFGGLLQSGVGFLSQFGHVLGQVGLALDNLVKADPGIAHFLLDIIGGAASLFNLFTKLPAPILQTVLAFHGIYIWGGAAAGVLSKLGGPLAAVGRGFKSLGEIQIAGLAALTVIAFHMADAWNKASPEIVSSIAKINTSLSSMPASQAVSAISADIGSLTSQLKGVTLSSEVQNWATLPAWSQLDDRMQAAIHSLGNIGKTSESWKGTFKDIGNIFDQIGRAVNSFSGAQGNLAVKSGDASVASIQQKHDLQALNDEISKLLTDQSTLFKVTGDLTFGFNSFGIKTKNVSQSLAIMDLAGIRASDSSELMLQKINNLVVGYQNMGVQGDVLSGAVNAVTFATLQQQSTVAKLTGAYSTWFDTITGGETTFVGFAQNISKLDGAMQLSTANMGGLTDAQLAGQQQFEATAKSAQDNFNAIVTLANAAGLGSKGTDMLTQAMKDYMALLIPAAKGNDGLQTSLIGMAQEVNPNITSFKQLTTWVGNVKDPMQSLDKIQNTFAGDSVNLTSDIQNLSTALGTTLSGAMATAMLAATGGTKNFTAFAAAVIGTGSDSKTTQQAAFRLGGQLEQLTGSVHLAHDQFMTFAHVALHLTRDQANSLWNNFAGPGANSMAQAGNHVLNLQGKLKNLGFNISNVHRSVDGLTSAVLHLPSGKNINVRLFTSGSGEIIVTGTGINTRTINTSTGQVRAIGGHTAKGALITQGTHSTADDVIIAVSKNELVVPANLVKAGYADNMRGMIPGFAGGGFTGPVSSAINSVGGAEADFGQSAVMAFAQADVKAAIAKLNAMRAAAQAAASRAGGLGNLPLGTGPHSGSAAVAQAFAKSILWAYGWGMNQWPFEQALWNQESGWNAYAVNASSGAYGIPQSLGHGHPYNLGDYQAQIRWGDAYISTRYGNPQNAWAHEVANNWYDNGGWLKPGWNPPMYNGTGRPEHLTPDNGGTGCITLEIKASGSSDFEKFMMSAIRKWVVVHGAGSAQRAFGRH